LASRRATRSRSCRRSRSSSASIAGSGCVAPTAAPPGAPNCQPACRREPAALAQQAALATLALRNRVSRRDTTELLRELFGAELSAASIDAIVQHAGEALAEPHAALADQIRSAAAVNVEKDRLAPTRRQAHALGRAHLPRGGLPDRHRREAQALLGEEFSGVACSDRWWAYDYLAAQRRQLCWAHLVRDFTAHSEGLGAQKEFGEAALKIAGELFAAWEQCRWDADRARLGERLGPLQAELGALLEQAARKSARNRRQRSFAKHLRKRWPALWSFASVPGIEPTNNHAERGRRGAVIYRKLSLGSQSERGERTIERLLSASVTCRLQGRSLFAYLTDVLAAKIRGDPIPSLA
jgi:transposase